MKKMIQALQNVSSNAQKYFDINNEIFAKTMKIDFKVYLTKSFRVLNVFFYIITYNNRNIINYNNKLIINIIVTANRVRTPYCLQIVDAASVKGCRSFEKLLNIVLA